MEDWDRTGLQGQSTEALWGLAVSRGETTVQGRRLGTQSSDALDSEHLTPLQLNNEENHWPDSLWVPPHTH